ncbi:MAG: glycosyltransferase family 4 protein, partial [Nitrososphaeraceae archaeon]
MSGINMRIGVDACCWSNRRGFGRFTRELLSALVAISQKNDYFFFVDNETASGNEFPDGMNIVVASTSVAPTQAASASGRRSLR